jgi:hypothetical protein
VAMKPATSADSEKSLNRRVMISFPASFYVWARATGRR